MTDDRRTVFARALAAARMERVGAVVGICDRCGCPVRLVRDPEMRAVCGCGTRIPATFFAVAARLEGQRGAEREMDGSGR